MKTGYHPMAPEIGYKPMQTLLKKTHGFTAIFRNDDLLPKAMLRLRGKSHTGKAGLRQHPRPAFRLKARYAGNPQLGIVV